MSQNPAPPDRSGDLVLIAQIRAGDSEAFTALVHRYTGRVYSIGLHLLRNDQDARDVVQETFLNVHRRLDSFRGESTLARWIGRIATNNALMKLRRRRRKPETSLEEITPARAPVERRTRTAVDRRPGAEQMVLNQELGARIRTAVDELPDSHRAVLILADYQGMSMKEIAGMLDLSVPNTKTRLHRARMSVREALSTYLRGAE